MKISSVVAIIPARCGSKSVPDKNIRDFGGKPLLAHSIEHALAAKCINRVIVSTDSEHYAAIARRHGAETPFLRPPEFATDAATDLDVFRHALRWLRENEGDHPQIVAHLRPTTPNRDPIDIDRMVEILVNDPSLDSVRSIVAAPETPYKMWFRNDSGQLSPVIEDGKESYNQARQTLPASYLQNASIDIVRSSVILEKNSMTGQRIYGYLMEESHDIDSHADMLRADRRERPTAKTFCFDIDGVIATLVPGNDYKLAAPHRETIDVLNRLHRAGHRIVLNTARGSMTGIDWSEITAAQMARWGVSYHELTFGKPAADFYIDDRAIGLTELSRVVDILTK